MKNTRYFGCSHLTFCYNNEYNYNRFLVNLDNTEDECKENSGTIAKLIPLDKDEYNLKGILLQTNYFKEPGIVKTFSTLDIFLIPINKHIGMVLNKELVELIINQCINPFIDYIENDLNCDIINDSCAAIILFDLVKEGKGKDGFKYITINDFEYKEYAEDSYVLDAVYDVIQRKIIYR